MGITHIIHGGQTGVDRGAHYAALDLGLKPTGYRPANGRDENGLIPGPVADHLIPMEFGGYQERTRANVILAMERRGALLIVVPNRLRWADTPGTKATVDYAEHRGVPTLVLDHAKKWRILTDWLAHIPRQVTHLMVAGPRHSMWIDGHETATALLTTAFKVVNPSDYVPMA